jgi:hypothetical protein
MLKKATVGNTGKVFIPAVASNYFLKIEYREIYGHSNAGWRLNTKLINVTKKMRADIRGFYSF